MRFILLLFSGCTADFWAGHGVPQGKHQGSSFHALESTELDPLAHWEVTRPEPMRPLGHLVLGSWRWQQEQAGRSLSWALGTGGWHEKEFHLGVQPLGKPGHRPPSPTGSSVPPNSHPQPWD